MKVVCELNWVCKLRLEVFRQTRVLLGFQEHLKNRMLKKKIKFLEPFKPEPRFWWALVF